MRRGVLYAKLKRAGAGEVLGIDVSAEMVRPAEADERARPTGCRYLNRDAADLVSDEPVYLVVAMYLLNYACDATELLRFVRAAHGALKPGGRFVSFNDNVLSAPDGTVSYARYGFEKVYAGTPSDETPSDGDPIVYRYTNDDGKRFEFNNYYLSPETYRRAFEEAGFAGFNWINPQLHPSEQDNGFWDEFIAGPPVIGYAAVKK